MTAGYKFNCVATGIGSMPHTDAAKACELIYKYLKQLPFWPQLPARSPLENMYLQYSQGFPGMQEQNGKAAVIRSSNFDEDLERLYHDYEEKRSENYGVTADHAAGLYAFESLKFKYPHMIKGQITGPISWGLAVTDEAGRGILYDDLLAETAAKFLHLKAAWQENFLHGISPHTIIFLDEPYLSSLGSAFVSISNQLVSSLLEEVMSGIGGIKGIHCCGATDWSLLLNSSTDILSFDTYNYADSLACYPAEVKAFLQRGGNIAWGIVPNDADPLAGETAASLMDRLGEAISAYTYDGISYRQVLSQSLLTPSCSLTSLSIDAAESALQVLDEVSRRLQTKLP
ncbi:MAG TPA: methionine synthase [Dehalococcoidia bacterium]|nr:methionine synthase [Dehalococcoidia bacterium]